MNKELNYKTIVNLQHKEVQGKKCSAVACMSIVNDDIYVLSSHSSSDNFKQPVVLHKLYNYISNSNPNVGYSYETIRTSKGSENIAVHANSMTYNNHLFYMVTRNGTDNENQVIVFGSDGIIKNKLKYAHIGSKLATINHYKDDKFIISVGGGNTIPYRVVQNSGNYLNDVFSFKLKIADSEYQTGNDSYYDKKSKKIYVTKFKDDLIHNAIYVYDLSKLSAGKTYTPTDVYYINAKNGESQFEIEGLGIFENNIYVCTNSVKNSKQTDSICKLL